MRWLSQTIAVTLLGVRTIPQRIGPSIVAIIGIGGVVVVFVSVLSIGEGFRAALTAAGAPDRAVVLRGGSDSEMTSGLTGDETDIIKQAPGIAQANRRPIAAAEMQVVIDLNKRTTGTPANVPVRGVEPESFVIRDEVKIIDGRMPQFGTNEVIVGRAALKQFAGADLGTHFKSGQLEATIVGVFSSNGSVNESELWCDNKILQAAYRRGNTYQSVVVKLDSPGSFDTFKNW